MIAAPKPPPPPDAQEQILSLHEKLDRLAEQVGYLHDRMQAAEELRHELVGIGKEVMKAAREELQAVEHEFNADEVALLLRKLLRSTPRFVWMLDHMESFAELLEELTPLGRELMKSGTELLDQAEKKGYFRMARGALGLADRVGENYENLDGISSKILVMMEGAFRGLDQELPQPVSTWGMLRSLRDPEIQQGMGLAFEVLRRVSRQARVTLGAGAEPAVNGKMTGVS